MKKDILTALRLLGLATALLGLAYPLAVTGIARLAMPWRAGGSLLERDGRVVGSRLLGQQVTRPDLFHARPSATGEHPYDAMASSGSNLGPSNPALRAAVVERLAALRAADPEAPAAVPADLVTASGSGLDPHVSLAGALYQVPRVAAARRLPVARVRDLVLAHAEAPWLGVFGEARVCVLELDLALEGLDR